MIDDLALLILTNGRGDCFSRTFASFQENVVGTVPARTVIINDSGDGGYQYFLETIAAGAEVIFHEEPRGFDGAIRSGWEQVKDHDYIFHLEDDFTFNEKLRIEDMVQILDSDPNIAQVALKRQPWGEAEIVAGGFMEMYPPLWTDENLNGIEWCWQQIFFTTNPSIYRGELAAGGWPECEASERIFTNMLLEANPEVRFAYLGATSDAPRVHHIGDKRTGIRY